jgi:hypothetical protein
MDEDIELISGDDETPEEMALRLHGYGMSKIDCIRAIIQDFRLDIPGAKKVYESVIEREK